MNEHREGDRSFGPQVPKVVWSLLIGLYLIYSISIFILTYKMQCRFKMEYKLFTIVRYNYRDYNMIIVFYKYYNR
jgi:hypothetical protein